MNKPRIEELTRGLLVELGENVAREGLQDTPSRVAESWEFLVRGYSQNPVEVLSEAIFDENYDEMLVAKNIEFYSLCEHHLLPFFGKCHIAYLPNRKIVGLSKLARAVDAVSRKLQVQERMTVELADAIDTALSPQGVGVVIEGFHTCMGMRGVEKQNCTVTTSAMRGAFRSDPSTRAEFLSHVRTASAIR